MRKEDKTRLFFVPEYRIFGTNLVALSIYWPAKFWRASSECRQRHLGSLLCSVSLWLLQSPIGFPGHAIMKKNQPSFTSQQCQRAGPLFSWFPAPVAEAELDATQRWHGQQRDPAEKQRFTCLIAVWGIYFGSIKANVGEKNPSLTFQFLWEMKN